MLRIVIHARWGEEVLRAEYLQKLEPDFILHPSFPIPPVVLRRAFQSRTNVPWDRFALERPVLKQIDVEREMLEKDWFKFTIEFGGRFKNLAEMEQLWKAGDYEGTVQLLESELQQLKVDPQSPLGRAKTSLEILTWNLPYLTGRPARKTAANPVRAMPE